MTSNGLHSNDPRPRLCHLRRWPDFVGYGFNLHCERAKPGQYIGKVDPNSPAESAGLRENDRIIEVNGFSVGTDNHKQVVSRIKEGVTRNGTKHSDEVILLVLDPAADDFFKSKSITVRGTDSNVIKLQSEPRNNEEEHSDNVSHTSYERPDSPIIRETPPQIKENNSKLMTEISGSASAHTKYVDSPTIPKTPDRNSLHSNSHQPSPSLSNKNPHREYPQPNNFTNTNSSPQNFYAQPINNTYSSQSSSGSKSGGMLDFHMSAAEYRDKLKAQNARKRDLRQDNRMSMKEKHDFIERM